MHYPTETSLSSTSDVITLTYFGEFGLGVGRPILWLRPNENKITFNIIPGQWQHGLVNVAFRRLGVLLQVVKKYGKAGYYIGPVKNYFDRPSVIEPVPGVYPYNLSHLQSLTIAPNYAVDFELNREYTIWYHNAPYQPFAHPRKIYIRKLFNSSARFTTAPSNPIGNMSTSYAQLRSLLVQPFDLQD